MEDMCTSLTGFIYNTRHSEPTLSYADHSPLNDSTKSAQNHLNIYLIVISIQSPRLWNHPLPDRLVDVLLHWVRFVLNLKTSPLDKVISETIAFTYTINPAWFLTYFTETIKCNIRSVLCISPNDLCVQNCASMAQIRNSCYRNTTEI